MGFLRSDIPTKDSRSAQAEVPASGIQGPLRCSTMLHVQTVSKADNSACSRNYQRNACARSVTRRVQLSVTPGTAACQTSLSMECFQVRMLEWVAISSPEDFPKPGIKPTSPALAGGFFTHCPTEEQTELNQTKSLSSRLMLVDPPISSTSISALAQCQRRGPKALCRWWGCQCRSSRDIHLVNIIHFFFKFSFTFLAIPTACGVFSSPNQGSNPGPLQRKCGVCITGPAGKFLHLLFKRKTEIQTSLPSLQ